MATDLRAAEVYAMARKAADAALIQIHDDRDLYNTLWLYKDGDWALTGTFWVEPSDIVLACVHLTPENIASRSALANALIDHTQPVDDCSFQFESMGILPTDRLVPRRCTTHDADWSWSKRFCSWVISSAAKVVR